MVSDEDLLRLAVRTGRHLLAGGVRMVTAESCTAGWIAKVLTDVPGSSDWFECGYVCYSNAAKQRDLGVQAATLEGQGAVSEPAVREMALGALERTGAALAIAVSGIAGPTGAVAGKPVGTVWFALAHRRGRAVELNARVKFFKGDRDAVRRKSVQFALQLVLGLELPELATASIPSAGN
ncbi:MAG: nicotinamide-nucleotide amidohydrolase family protein [Steroidobacteraceae bacterium]